MSDRSAFQIAPAEVAADVAAAAALFTDYAASLDVDLAAQGFEAELVGLPGAYGPPNGVLLLAKDAAGAALGCVALRPLAEGVCEMKRLYVRPTARGQGLATALVAAIIDAGTQAGYREIKLDTLASMTAAVGLYRALGFSEIPDYGGAAYPGLVCFGKALVA